MPDSNPSMPLSMDNPVPARRGSVSERFVKCNKAGCPCTHDPEARHGPYFSYTQAVKGRTHSRFLSAGEALVVRRQIERGKEFRNQVDSFWNRCEQAADKELDELAASPEAAKKGGSKSRSSRSSTPQPSRKSKRS